MRCVTAYFEFCAARPVGRICPNAFYPIRLVTTATIGVLGSGALHDILEGLTGHLRERGKIDLSEFFIDGTF